MSSCSISMITTAHANVRARSPRLRGVEELNPFALRMFAKFERGPTEQYGTISSADGRL